MDDSCAVCADTLEWVAYGPCGHREVCSTCVARLRFICDDRRCCICKSECQTVFITKALGDYTRTVSDFSTFPREVKEGQVGAYWYHEDTQAYFDDGQHYKMIRAMCRLSCSVCDRDDDDDGEDVRRKKKNQSFRNIGQLKRHISNQHNLRMCHLCLESRKVFICEQKLYTRAQLNRHMRTGDSEVDGIESERGGFSGHPMCEFCRSHFYGENELYSHMSTEHYTCHICQRRHPGQFEYYKDYDDLEIHFRHDHFLCEDEACLGKKFIVFQTEADLKRHNALEHGGRMSRSKRNVVLQIPTSFRYRSSNETGQDRGRRRSFRRESSYSEDHELSVAIEASLDRRRAAPNVNEVVAGPESGADVDDIVQPFESLSATTETETTTSSSSSRYRQAVAQTSTNASLTESLFPPLSSSSSSSSTGTTQQKESQNTMAALLRRQNKATVLNVGHPRPPPPTSSAAWPAPSPSTSASTHIKPPTVNGSALSTYARTVNEPSRVVASRNGSRLNHSNSAPNLTQNRYFDPVSDFPPVSVSVKTEDNVQSANKSLVERMRAALDYDENKYSAFKEISQEYRQGLIGTWEYLGFVKQFDLTHLVLDLARLCPDVEKQKELIEAYNATCQSESGSTSRKEKGKKVKNTAEELAEKTMRSVKSLQMELQQQEANGGGEVEVLEKDGYRVSKGKVGGEIPTLSASGSASASGSKQKKKTSKFHRIRLGDNSVGAVLDVRNGSSVESETNPPLEGSSGSTRGVWQRGGGAQRLFAK